MNLKKFFSFGILALTLFISAFSANAQTPASPPPNLVGFWAGDGNANDIANGNNGILQNGAGFAVGKVGQGFSFDGTDDFVSIPSSSTLDFGVNDFSIELWFKLNTTVGDQTLIHKTVGSFPNSQEYLLESSNGGLRFLIRNTTSNENDLNVSTVISPNIWYHVSAVRQGDNSKIYLNGSLIGNQTTGTSINTGSGNATVIGKLASASARFVNGQIDEVSLYNRALTSTEIASIFNSGIAGKTKQVTTISTANRAALWQAEGNGNDFTGVNNGTLFNGTSFVNGNIGRAFDFVRSLGQYVEIPDSPSLSPSTQITTAAWVKLAGDHDQSVIGKIGTSSVTVQNSFFHGFYLGRTFVFCVYASGYYCRTANSPISLNQWIHTAATFDTTTQEMKLFINGIEIPSTVLSTSSIPAINDSDTPVRISGNPEAYPDDFDGQVDDATIYGRVLSPTEIQAIYNAGNGSLGDATVTFQNVTTAGITQQVPIDLSSYPSLPIGSTATGLAYDISTTAIFSGSPKVCFNLPSITDSGIFNNLRIVHLESGVWTNRTDLTSINFASKTICTTGLTSLSPFAVVNGFAPSAANGAIRGRITTANGAGIRGVNMSLTTMSGKILSTMTGTFGYYRFENLPVGETYILSVSSKRYSFENSTRIIDLSEDLAEINFTAVQER